MKNHIIFLAASIFLFSACNTTRITSSWVDPNLKTNNYKNILVLGMFQQKDRSLRTEVESQFVKVLSIDGFKATSGFEEYGPKTFQNLSEDQIVKKLRDEGYDAVITTTLLDQSKDRYYNPGSTSIQPVGYARFGRYITTIYDRVYEPGYYTSSTQYFLESNFYDLSNGDLKYSVQSKTADPSSAYDLGKNYSQAIVKDLEKKKVLMGH